MLPYGPLTALIVAAATSPSRAALAPALADAAGPTASPAPSWDFETTVAATATTTSTTTAAGDPVIPTATTTTAAATTAAIAAPAEVDPPTTSTVVATTTTTATTTATTATSTTAPAEVGTATTSTATSAPEPPGSTAAATAPAADDDDAGTIGGNAPASSSPSLSLQASVATADVGRFCGATLEVAASACDQPCDEECGPGKYCFPMPLETCGRITTTTATAVSTTTLQSGESGTAATTTSMAATQPLRDRYCGPSWLAASQSCSYPCPSGLDAECLVPGERCFDYTGCSSSPVPTTPFPTFYPTFSPTLSPSISPLVTFPDDGTAVTVSGSVFWDADGDGLRDEATGAAPTVLAGVVVNLYTCVRNDDFFPGATLLRTRTDAAGRYAFANPFALSRGERGNLLPALDRWGVTRFRAAVVLPGPAGRYAFSPRSRDSDVDPADGRTACWDLGVDGRRVVAWDAGITNAAPPPPTFSPTTASPTASAPPSRRYDGDNYCGASWVWAAITCSIPCPGGEDSECPDGEGCFYFTGCSRLPTYLPTSAPTTTAPPSRRYDGDKYCGANWAGASGACSIPCPGGEDSECPRGETCYYFTGCSSDGAKDGPTCEPIDCQNGLFNLDECACQCIPPYCPHPADGTCTLPSNDCGTNPWRDCVMGEGGNCPWWVESWWPPGECTSGPEPPPDIWDIYGTLDECCDANFESSDACKSSSGPGPVCDIPISGCTNGMFNQALCQCECIRPFCPDANGDCTAPTDNCGGNKWADCARGVNCPWWVDPLRAESCFTGPDVPLGLWQIYNSEASCCNTNFPYSDRCVTNLTSNGPTRHPTIAAPGSGSSGRWYPDYNAQWALGKCENEAPIPIDRPSYATGIECCQRAYGGQDSGICLSSLPTPNAPSATTGSPPTEWPTVFPSTLYPAEDDIYEVVPIKFDVSGLPEDIRMRELRDEMAIVMKRILIRLADRIQGLKISKVEEKVADSLQVLQEKQRMTLYFNVIVMRDVDRKFGPLIITEMRNSYDDILDQIQTFEDTKYFEADLNLNWCTSQNGEFNLCVKEIIKKPPRPGNAPSPATAFPSPDPFNSTSTRGPSNDANATLTKSVEPTTANHNEPSKKPTLSPENPQQNAPALPRTGDWYPDYDSDICKNDGLQYPFEINFFETYETCCEFDLIDTEKCLEARKDANEGDDELNLDFSGCFATRQTAMLSILSLLVMTLSWL